MVMSLLESLYKSLYKNAKDPTLSILGHHGGRRKIASLRPPFSTPATPRDKHEPANPSLPLQNAPRRFLSVSRRVEFWSNRLRLPYYPLLSEFQSPEGQQGPFTSNSN